MLPYSFIGKWDYTNPATPVAVNIPMTDKPDWIYVKNLTNWGDGSVQTAIESEWYSSMAQGSYIQMGQGGSAGGGSYGYAYALTPQTVASYTALGTGEVLFDAVGPSVGVSTTLGQSDIVVANAGTYLVTFQVSGTGPNQFAIFVNDVPQQSTVGGSGAGTQQNSISSILTLPAGAVINLVNYVTGSGVALASTVGGTQPNVTANVTISQLAAATGSSVALSQGTTGGFTFVDQTNPPTYSKVSITAVSGTTFVVSTANTAGIAVGDLVRLINVVGAHELSGILFQVTAVSAGVSVTLGFASTAQAAYGTTYGNGTTGFMQKVYPGFMYPGSRQVLFISQATQAKVYFARQNDFTPGELVDFQIPVPYGMIQMSNLTATPVAGGTLNNPGAARVLVVTNTASESSITLDYDTTGFTAFVYPSSATFAGGPSPAVCFPAGSGIVPLNGSATIPQSPPGTNLQDAFDNKAQYVMNLGTNVVGAANAHMVVMAFKADFNNAITNA